MIQKKTIIPLLLIISSLVLVSWGVIGHRAIGQIAQNHLTKKAKAATEQLLGTESLAMVSTYPDEIRPYSQYAYTAPWHYVNLPDGLPYEAFSKQLQAIENPNIYKAALNCIQDLKDPVKSKDEKIFALKFLVHLIGDMHQPMHLGHSEDSGGNDIKVKLMRRESNLHRLWDSDLIDYEGRTYSELAEAYDEVSTSERKQWQKDDMIQWLYESYQISQQLYAEAAQNPDFNYDYYPRHAEIVKKRIAQAGIRLAGILNEIYQ